MNRTQWILTFLFGAFSALGCGFLGYRDGIKRGREMERWLTRMALDYADEIRAEIALVWDLDSKR